MSPRTAARVLVALLVASVGTAGLAAATTGDAGSATAVDRPAAVADGQSDGDGTGSAGNESDDWLPEQQVQVAHGNATSFDVRIPESASGPVTLNIGGEHHSYHLAATLRDEDGDGTVTLEFDTAATGSDGRPLTARGADEVNATETGDLTGDSDAKAYALNVTVGTSPDAEEVDAESLAVIYDTTHLDVTWPDADSGSGAADDGSSTDERSTDDDEWLPESAPAAQVGETVYFQVNLQPSADGSVTLSVGDGDEYLLVATLRDGDGDDEIDVRFDTAAVGTGENPLGVGGDDGVVLHRQFGAPDDGLGPGNYEMNLTLGQPPDGREVAVGTVVVEPADNAPDGTEASGTPTDGPWTWGDRDSVIPGGGIVTVQRGEAAHVPVQVKPGASVLVEIARPGTPDDYRVAVSDDDEDGRIPLLFRTGAVDDGSHRVAVEGSDSVTLEKGSSDTDALAAGHLDINVFDDTPYPGDEIGVGVLQILEGGNESETETAENETLEASRDGDESSDDLGALAAVGVGGLLAVVGVAVLFGVRRQ